MWIAPRVSRVVQRGRTSGALMLHSVRALWRTVETGSAADARVARLLARALQKEVIEAGTLKDLHRTIASTAALSAQLQSVLVEQNRNLTETMASFRTSAAHLSSVADSAQIQATLVNLRQTSENAARFSANLDSTNAALRKALAQMQNGNGTVGKLLTDSLLYSDIRHLVQQTDSLMADFKKNPRKYINLKIF